MKYEELKFISFSGSDFGEKLAKELSQMSVITNVPNGTISYDLGSLLKEKIVPSPASNMNVAVPKFRIGQVVMKLNSDLNTGEKFDSGVCFKITHTKYGTPNRPGIYHYGGAPEPSLTMGQRQRFYPEDWLRELTESEAR